MDDRKILLLGGKGMLGSDLAAICRAESLGVRVLDLPEFDITDESQLDEIITGNEIIINCAAYTNVEKAESEPDIAFKVNAEAVGRLGRIAAGRGSYIIHYSTDFVFDGASDSPYIETDSPNPLSAYGKSKLEGEFILAGSGCSHCIIRLQWTYGQAGNNFIKKIIELAKTRPELKVVDDQTGSPTSTKDIAAATLELIKRPEGPPEGLFHYAASGYASRYEVAKYIIDALEIETLLKSCSSSEFPSAAKRPASSRFNCQKIQALLTSQIKPWQESLEDFLKRFKAD